MSVQILSKDRLEEFLKDYEGSLLDLESLPKYDRETLPFFSDEGHLHDPYLDFSFEHDITAAVDAFLQIRSRIADATLTSYLVWLAVKSMNQVRNLRWRCINGCWYEFKHLPTTMPVATGLESRLSTTFIHDGTRCSFAQWNSKYREAIELAKSGKQSSLGSADVFFLSNIILNLPNLKFTGIRLHQGTTKAAHVFWVFGKRTENQSKWTMPMMIRMHHSNGDPVILTRLLEAFDQNAGQI